jgi:hypothetical protein
MKINLIKVNGVTYNHVKFIPKFFVLWAMQKG